MVVIAPVERFGVQRHNNIVIDLGNGELVTVVVCHLAVDGTLRQIFERFKQPFEVLAHAPAVIEAFFKEQHKHELLPEDRATLFLRQFGPDLFDVVRLELEDDTGQIDEFVFDLDGDWIWLAEHGHHIVVDAKLFPEES